MATSAATLEPQPRALQISRAIRIDSRSVCVAVIAALAIVAVAIEGYHPFAEDGGLYAAGVERLLDPTLFPQWTGFVLAPMRISAFAPAIASLVRITHLTVPAVLLLVHIASIFATLLTAYCIAAQCWLSIRARLGAVALLACWMGLPVAGTSLQLIDPYVTARSFSTPCVLLALLAVLRFTSDVPEPKRRRWLFLCAASLTVASAMHPLMAGYGIAATCLSACLRSRRRAVQFAGTISCCAAALLLAGALQHVAPPESHAYVAAALTRTYWFLREWRWYELVGLAAPLVILAACSSRWFTRLLEPCDRTRGHLSASAALATMATVLGVTAILVALLYARPEASTHLVARLQPLRAFQTVYMIMILMFGALLGEYLLQRHAGRWIAAMLILGAPVFVADRATFPSSRHIQISDTGESNPWIQSFDWARTHTPKDALFALDPDYIHAPGEDGHCFRAIAQRSVLPDYSKDGGEASIAPQLAEPWLAGLRAQRNLIPASLLLRNSPHASALRALGVSWVILRRASPTDLSCPYSNFAAKVCRIS